MGEPAARVSAEPVSKPKPEARTRTGSARPTESRQTQRSGNANARGSNSLTAVLEAQPRAEQHETYVAARISELRDLSRKTEPASLETLLSEINNPDQEIREAALDIISQSGKRGAIPRLLEVAALTEDASQKQAIDDAVEFLKLPTLTEVLSQTDQRSGNSGMGADEMRGVPKPPGTSDY